MRKFKSGVNDFKTWCEQNDCENLLAEWDFEKNIGLTPSEIPYGSEKLVYWKCSKGHEWSTSPNKRTSGGRVKSCPICANRRVLAGYNDLATTNPDLAKEWNYEKNGDLTPDNIVSGSHEKVWWKCSKGHEWEAKIDNRSNGNCCPYCANKKLLKGFNDLATTYPMVAKEWDYDKNAPIIPSDIFAGSIKKYWWKCSKGHEWITSPNSRIETGHIKGCPICANMRVLAGYNDLATTNPDLAKEWNYEKNGNLTPDNIVSGSHEKVWWKCSKGHEWEAAINGRSSGKGCPYCSGQRVLAGYNDLATSNPDLAKEWCYEKNGDLSPADVSIGTKKKVWWKCANGHEWETTIFKRLQRHGCPYCSRNEKSANRRGKMRIGKKPIKGINDLATLRPDLLLEWDYDKNQFVSPSEVTICSSIKVWWKCSKGHEWESAISNRKMGHGCPICSNRIVQAGYNDLATTNPDLAKEWCYEKNGDAKPTDFSVGSGKKVWWKCSKGHEWEAAINGRSSGKGCPYCSGQRVLAGYNDLATSNPDLAKEWCYERNGDLSPADVSIGTKKKVWWKCANGHEWEASISSRNSRGCPYCSGKRVQKGVNDLSTINPDLAKEWNYSKNIGLEPSEFRPGSSKKVWWKCKQGHEWEAVISSRTRGNGCPYCSGHLLLPGVNDLESNYPDLAKEWNYKKNGDLTPSEITIGSDRKVWWRCNKGHEWQTRIQHRTNGHGCPFCSPQSSLPEYTIYYYLSKYFNTQWRAKPYDWELDCYIEEFSIGIEYDGIKWHENMNSLNRELRKEADCKRQGIQLFRIKEATKNYVDGIIVYYKYDLNYSELNYAIRSLLSLLSEKTSVVVDIDSIDFPSERTTIENAYRQAIKRPANSVLNNLALISEWDFEKNTDVNPEFFSVNSKMKVWWKCANGHEWKASIVGRTAGSKCPYCSNRLLLCGFNDFKTLYPKLANEWNYIRNGSKTPESFLPTSREKVWWICNKGHEWKTTISSRRSGTGCPHCAGHLLQPGVNDLLSQNPNLAAQWNYEKNNGLLPSEVTKASEIKVWWICSKGHEWQANVCDRSQGNGCPICSGHKVLAGYNDLATLLPDLSKEWNYEKNNGLLPSEVTKTSGKKVWWKCSKGHEWQAIISNRAKGYQCPYCSNIYILQGDNDLETLYPQIAKEWNYEKNDGLKPSEVGAFSHKSVWWKCSKGHEWKTNIKARVNGTRCPYCIGKKVIVGVNDLETLKPELALEWNIDKNGSLTPKDVKLYSNKKVWWKCSKGHEWKVAISIRAKGSKCPICSGRKVEAGFNDLATVNPKLSSEWNYEKNKDLKPSDVTRASGKKVWWRCSHGHEWQATVHDRSSGKGCPFCARKKKQS